MLPVPGMVLLLQGEEGDRTCTQSPPWQGQSQEGLGTGLGVVKLGWAVL